MFIYPTTKIKVISTRAPRVLRDENGKHQKAADGFCAVVRVGEVYTFEELQRIDAFIWKAAGISDNNCRKFTTPKEFYERRIKTGILVIVE